MTRNERDELMVPLAHPEDLQVVGSVAATYAALLDLPVKILVVLYPEDDADLETQRYTTAVDTFAATHRVDAELSVIVSDNFVETLVTACREQWTCAYTSGSVFDEHHYVGSFASALLAVATKPVILIGPEAHSIHPSVSAVSVARSATVSAKAAAQVGEDIARRLRVPVFTIQLDPENCDPAERLVERTENALLVLTTTAPSGLEAICSPSTTLETVQHAKRPVIALGPNAA